jgi:hypothetical protein
MKISLRSLSFLFPVSSFQNGPATGYRLLVTLVFGTGGAG